MHLNNNNNPNLDRLIDNGTLLTSTQMVDGPYFEVSVLSAVKLMYPILEQELTMRGYSTAHVGYRLKYPCNSDVELIDIIEGVIRDFDEDYSN